MVYRPLFLALSVCICLTASSATAASSFLPTGLRCEYAANPLGIDTATPRLSWRHFASVVGDNGQAQTAYQILAATTRERLEAGDADLWDSGRVEGARQLNVPYDGKPLSSAQRVWWTVRAWDEAGRPSNYASAAWFETGLLQASDWQGSWIGKPTPPLEDEDALFGERPAPLLRKGFQIEKPVARARAYVTGLGYYELRLNGEKVGDHELDPGWTAYDERVLYSTFDVTEMVRAGENALGIILGNGWYDPLPLKMWGWLNIRDYLPTGTPRALLQLDIDFEDGTRTSVVTDPAWRCAEGPIRKNDVYLGEVYDARQEKPGWDAPGFDDSEWEAASAMDAPAGELAAQMAEPIRVTEVIHPVNVTEPAPGTYLYDLGVNFAGRVQFTCEGPAGTEVKLRYGELLHEDGSLNPNTAACGQIKGRSVPEGSLAPSNAYQEDTFILAGQGRETFRPRFTFHGFRYVSVTGLPSAPALGDLLGERLRTDVTRAGQFRCSNDLFNQIQTMTVRTIESNLHGVQSDCPTREKFGYGGDIVACSDACLFNFDMARFYTKAVTDLADAQRENGAFTETAPYVGIGIEGLGEGAGPVGWGTAHPLLLHRLNQHYGERGLLAEQYPLAKRWLDLLLEKADEGILNNGIGDHESRVPKETAVSGTAFLYQNVVLLRDLARTLGKTAEVSRLEDLAGQLRKRFRETFYDAETGAVGSGTQANQAFGLYLDLLPAEDQAKAMARLAQDVLEQHDGHLTTGIFGTKYLLDASMRHDAGHLAHTVAQQTSEPGWGYMLENGATTLWEHWAFSDNTYSHNHPMFGSISEWFYRSVAGIRAVDCGPDGPGHVTMAPQPGGGLTWASASYTCPYGEIYSGWRLEDDGFELTLTVPIGMRATIILPAPYTAGVETTKGAPPTPIAGRESAYEAGPGRLRLRAKRAAEQE